MISARIRKGKPHLNMSDSLDSLDSFFSLSAIPDASSLAEPTKQKLPTISSLSLNLPKCPRTLSLTLDPTPNPPQNSLSSLDAKILMEGGGSTDGPAASIARWKAVAWRTYQHCLDRATPHSVGRWVGTLAVLAVYAMRVYYVQGFYIVSYGLGIYLLNLLIGFLSPVVDPELETPDGPGLPRRGADEFKPFMRRLPEFKFWYSITKAICIAFVMTFFSVFDVPVFWPILLFYWIVLLFLTMKRQILHMIKYKYIPFNMGKQKYTGKKAAATNSSV